MAGMTDQLTKVMYEQAERHNELYGLSLEEKDAIIANDIAEVTGNKKDGISLSDVIEILKDQPAEQEKLRTAGTKLREAVDKLREVNELNKSLLESSIEFVEYSLNALRSTLAPEPPEYPRIQQGGSGSDDAGIFNATR
jgi:flagellar biosynthesis/type III secretory pathway chaperone